MAVCIAAYESTGSQVQLSLERGLPAMIGNFIARQLPFPSLSFDMAHCAQCDIFWDEKGNYIVNGHYSFINRLSFKSYKKSILEFNPYLLALLLSVLMNRFKIYMYLYF
jgi:hypothetical protein